MFVPPAPPAPPPRARRYFTEWALTLFSRGFSFDLVTRVWDVLMTEGSYKIVYRVALALLKVCALPHLIGCALC